MTKNYETLTPPLNGGFSRLGELPSHPDMAVYRGINAWYRDQLIAKSRQEHILQHTPKDAESRFKDLYSFNVWYAKGRMPFVLGTDNGDLAGIVWYGKEKSPDYIAEKSDANHTFAIRLYEGHFGKGLGKPFMRYTLQKYMHGLTSSELDRFEGIWLETCDDNDAAMALYPKFGFEIMGNDKERVGMVLSPESIRDILLDPGA